MALKLRIRPEIEEEMESLLPASLIRSKTEYINRAIQEYNRQLKRQAELARLKEYFQVYQKEGQVLLSEFAQLKPHSD